MADAASPDDTFDVLHIHGVLDAPGMPPAPPPPQQPIPRLGDNIEAFDVAAPPSFDMLANGGPGAVGDWCRRRKADGFSTTSLTSQSIAESGAGFWPDMARMGGASGGGGGGPDVSPNTTNIYVDSVAGDDANSGLSIATAKKTIASAVIPLTSNVNINLKRGSYWREKLNTSSLTGIWVMDYGTGTLPVLDCADIIPNAGWTQPNVGTYPNVWQIVVASSAAISSNFASIWVAGTRLKFVNGIAAIVAGTFTILGSSNGQYGTPTTTFQIYSTTNPNTNSVLYEYAARDFGFSGANAVHVTNIHTRRNAHNNGSFDAGRDAIVTGCIFEDGCKHNAYASPGTVMTDCIAWKCDWQAAERDGWIGIVSHNNGLTGTEITTFIRCQVVCDVAGMAAPQAQTAFYCHTDGGPGSNWAQIIYTDCSVQNVQQGFDADNCLGVAHTRTHIRGCKVGISVPDGPTSNAINTLTDCWLEDSDGIRLQRGILPAGASTTIDGLRMCQDQGANDGYIYGGTSNVTLTRSALARPTGALSGYMTFLSMGSSTLSVAINGNVMWGGNVGFGEILLSIAAATLGNNAYGSTSSDMSANGSGTVKLGPYLTAAHTAGRETGSISYNVNPFTNAAAGNFTLTVASGLNPATFGCARFPTYQIINTAPSLVAAMVSERVQYEEA